MKKVATPYEWRKNVVTVFDAQIESLQRQRDAIQQQLDEQIRLRDALKTVELKRPYNKGDKTEAKPGRKWTPEQRKAQAARMKKLRREGKIK